MPDQEEKKQGSFIGKTANTYSTVRTVFGGLGRTATAAIFGAGPEVWIVIGFIAGLVLLTVLIVMVAAPISFSPTPSSPSPTTAPPPNP